MAALPEIIDPTLEAVDRALEERQDRSQRPYLGASSIGDPCSRKLWYGFRWAMPPQFKAKTLKAFEDGHRGEDMQAARLRLVSGVELSTHNIEGEQWGISDHEGHFRGHCDGFIRGILQAPKTPHIWEHKVCNEKKFASLAKLKKEKGEKEALLHWDEIYYAQAQVYMKKFDLSRHYLTCSTPGGRETVSVRTNFNREAAEGYLQKAKDIIVSDAPPVRLSEDSTFYKCKWCDYHSICHDITPMAMNCRTCVHSFPDRGGVWGCTRHGELSADKQRKGCDDYVGIDG